MLKLMLKRKRVKSRTIQARDTDAPKIAYILGLFPELSETFVLQELLELERQGVPICIFSLFKPSITKGIEVLWPGQAPVTCISLYPRKLLLMTILQYVCHAPLRCIQTGIIMLGQYRLKFLIGCRVLLFATFLAAQFEQENILHMHAHFASESTAVAQFTHLLTGIPYSFTAHAKDIYHSTPEALAYKIQMARFVVTISEYNRKYLANLVDQNMRARIQCIYNGLNFREFSAISTDTSYTHTPPLILSVCRLVEKKGLIYLLQACRILLDQGHIFMCQIVGDGPLHQYLEQTIHALALSDTVTLLGARTHKQTIGMYQDATIMALPCIISADGDRDGIPTALIEALYAGVASVSTTVSGIPELITSEVNGLLVPPDDSVALAGALARLLTDPALCSRLTAAGHRTVLERFDLAYNASCLRNLFYADPGEPIA